MKCVFGGMGVRKREEELREIGKEMERERICNGHFFFFFQTLRRRCMPLTLTVASTISSR